MRCGLITNGWLLLWHVDALADAGLGRLIISIDSGDLEEHERHRGLGGLGRGPTQAIARARSVGLPVHASVTVSRLVRYDKLPELLRHLGIEAVAFSYPRREPFGSTSLVYGGDSPLIDLDRDELLGTLREIYRVSEGFPVLNPRPSLAEVARYVRGEPQLISCVGGYKYFYGACLAAKLQPIGGRCTLQRAMGVWYESDRRCASARHRRQIEAKQRSELSLDRGTTVTVLLPPARLFRPDVNAAA